MTAAQQVCEKALSLVGQGYIYGAKGQTCSPAFRRQQAQQYPEQADTILGTGEKWDGKPVWDCAQLTRAAAKAAGADEPTQRAMFDCVTTDEMLRILEEKRLLSGTTDALKTRIDAALCNRFRGLSIGVIVFTTGNRELFQNGTACAWRHAEEKEKRA